jgi:enoyl-[acyl-carrier-protein] reductase (NADH)
MAACPSLSLTPSRGRTRSPLIQKATLLNRAATLADVGNVAALVASDQARTMTATEVNISCGAMMD